MAAPTTGATPAPATGTPAGEPAPAVPAVAAEPPDPKSLLKKQFNELGAASDRAGKPDLYYTIFAIGGALALDVPWPVERTRDWLLTFGEGANLAGEIGEGLDC